MNMDLKSFNDLVGQTLSDVIVSDAEIHFVLQTGETYGLYHDQDCCEHVYVESVVGDFSDLIGTPILKAEESTSDNETPEGIEEPKCPDYSYTWTFYKLATIKGYVDVRFYGESNGYYSEYVSFGKIS